MHRFESHVAGIYLKQASWITPDRGFISFVQAEHFTQTSWESIAIIRLLQSSIQSVRQFVWYRLRHWGPSMLLLVYSSVLLLVPPSPETSPFQFLTTCFWWQFLPCALGPVHHVTIKRTMFSDRRRRRIRSLQITFFDKTSDWSVFMSDVSEEILPMTVLQAALSLRKREKDRLRGCLYF